MTTDVAALSLDELEEELATLAAHVYAGTCRWLELVAELDRRGSWSDSGCGSCAEWLAWRCALTPRSAREHVRVARRLGELQSIHAAFARGELSYAKVRALTRVAEPASEEELLPLAFAMTAAQLERALRAYRRVSTEEARVVHEQEFLSWHWDDDGSLVVRGRLAPEDGVVLLQALAAARDRLRRDAEEEGRGSAEPREPESRPSNVDALVAVADSSLGAEGARSGGERYQVVVHVDEEALAAEERGGVVLEAGPAVAAETARRLACDASVVRMSARRGKPLGVGRRTRAVSPALRRALAARDHGCRFPGCENRRFVDAHHVHHWARGGETRLDNLVLLCRRHHRLVHEGGYGVEVRGERISFTDRHGRRLAASPKPRAGSSGALRRRNRGSPISARTCRNGDGDRMDLALTVAGLRQILARIYNGGVTNIRGRPGLDVVGSPAELQVEVPGRPRKTTGNQT